MTGMRARAVPAVLLLMMLAAVLPAAPPPAQQQQEQQDLEAKVRQTEAAFAKSMADRDHRAFVSFLANDAIFLAGGGRALRGAGAVAEGWKRYFNGPQAPFSWAPETVVVTAGGSLALSTGPVRDPAGKRVGTFNSAWRREKNGSWKIVLDNGCPPCNCESGGGGGAR